MKRGSLVSVPDLDELGLVLRVDRYQGRKRALILWADGGVATTWLPQDLVVIPDIVHEGV